MSKLMWHVGLIASISGALVGQAEFLDEPWRHYVTIIFIITTAVSGYMIEKPRKVWSEEDRKNANSNH